MTVRAVLDNLAGQPARLDALVDRLVARIRAAVPEYATIPDHVLRRGNRQIVAVAVGHLRDGCLPDAAELHEITEIGVDRARQGISVAAVLAAYRVSGEEFWKVLSAEAHGRGASDAALLSTVEFIWQWLDVVTVAAAAAHREAEPGSYGVALRALLTRPGADTYLWQLGLDPAGRYAAVRGRLAPGITVSTLRERGLVMAVDNREVLGLVSGPDVIEPRFGTFGIGPLVAAADLHTSYLTAGRVLAAAVRLGLTGSHRLDTLRLTYVAATDQQMTHVLSSRILAPLSAKGPYGADIWRSVVSYMDSRMCVAEAAAALHVHPNTLRHRLAQFTALTGVSLRDPADLAEIWWLTVAGRQ
ncbi:PucR family transcriptional regulator [Kibdelosporangium aridum]|uniref:DNA-binding transcriptional regulator, PucR family n=1 Tax=Kibdelosporangium aridum TaxID=2030 RepID=A0A1Y5Y1B9_KIBAR|nr:PucR family transcriptional regulator [Kibdelosporangium aridum]SMD22888.1 DNA-binding transcriptional regulator, PucR family [Kibdelosporangium aridum]